MKSDDFINAQKHLNCERSDLVFSCQSDLIRELANYGNNDWEIQPLRIDFGGAVKFLLYNLKLTKRENIY